MITANILTKAQMQAGYYLDEDEDTVYLMKHAEPFAKLIGIYNSRTVTIQTLQHDADTHMSGIVFHAN